MRQFEDEVILVVANLSRHVQFVELDLAKFKGAHPVELFGRTRFPTVGDLPYLLTLGGHAFYWFSLERATAAERQIATYQPPSIEVAGGWDEVFADAWPALADALPEWMRTRKWFGGQGRTVERVDLEAAVAVDVAHPVRLAIVSVVFTEGEPERYVLPLSFQPEPVAGDVRARAPHAVLAHLLVGATRKPGATLSGASEGTFGVLVDAGADGPTSMPLFAALTAAEQRKWKVGPFELEASFKVDGGTAGLEPRALRPDHEAATVAYGERILLKLYRRLDDGRSPELEVLRHLSARGYANAPAALGALEIRVERGAPLTFAVLETFVHNEGDAWSYTRAELRRFYERALAVPGKADVEPPTASILELGAQEPPPAVRELLGSFVESAALLGRRIGELHLALAADTEGDFAPEPYSAMDQRSAYQSMRNLTGRVLRTLRTQKGTLPQGAARTADELLAKEEEIYKRFEAVLERRLTALRGRLHGHFHLGQVLFTGKDFVMIDFEQARDRPLPERRRKRSPLRDVAGIVRSFHYAAISTLLDPGIVRTEDRVDAARWAQVWQPWICAAFLRAYLAAVGSSPIVPRDRAELAILLDAFVLEKSLRELGDELLLPEGTVLVPLYGVAQLLGVGPPELG